MAKLFKEKVHSYSKHTIAYVEYLCGDFSQLFRLYENLKTELTDEKIWCFTSKQINTKINLYRPSDTTAEAALKLLERERDKEFRQVAIFIESVINVYRNLIDTEKTWFYTNLLDKKNDSKRSLEDKRLRYKILSKICYSMGIPEDGPIIKNKLGTVAQVEEECLRNF